MNLCTAAAPREQRTQRRCRRRAEAAAAADSAPGPRPKRPRRHPRSAGGAGGRWPEPSAGGPGSQDAIAEEAGREPEGLSLSGCRPRGGLLKGPRARVGPDTWTGRAGGAGPRWVVPGWAGGEGMDQTWAGVGVGTGTWPGGAGGNLAGVGFAGSSEGLALGEWKGTRPGGGEGEGSESRYLESGRGPQWTLGAARGEGSRCACCDVAVHRSFPVPNLHDPEVGAPQEVRRAVGRSLPWVCSGSFLATSAWREGTQHPVTKAPAALAESGAQPLLIACPRPIFSSSENALSTKRQ